MNSKINISYQVLRDLLLEILRNYDFSKDKEANNLMKAIVANDMDKPYSKIVVDRECRIFLPNFSSKEIKLSPLPKALYLLFLSNKDGYYYKLLEECQEDFIAIYQIVRGTDIFKARKTIESLVNPTPKSENRIYENCRLVREELKRVVPRELYEEYSLTGEKGKRYRISLNREQVCIEHEKLNELFNTIKNRKKSNE